MSTYVVRPESGHGLFTLYAVVSSSTHTVVTRTASPSAARHAAEVLNASQHTSHRKRHRRPLWYTFMMSVIRTSNVLLIIIYLSTGITEAGVTGNG